MCEKFRDYLFYAPYFTVYTDNNPLTYVMSTAKLNAVGHRWVGELSDFWFDVKYQPKSTSMQIPCLIFLWTSKYMHQSAWKSYLRGQYKQHGRAVYVYWGG